MTVSSGSLIAKNGFKNEDEVINKFNNWRNDINTKDWIRIMGYDINQIQELTVVKGHKIINNDIKITRSGPPKADIQIRIMAKNDTFVENLQIKLISNKTGFNQVDKRFISKYSELWNIPSNMQFLLKKFTGEILPDIENPKNKKRMFIYEFKKKEQLEILNFFNSNRKIIMNSIFKGQEGPKAGGF